LLPVVNYRVILPLSGFLVELGLTECRLEVLALMAISRILHVAEPTVKHPSNPDCFGKRVALGSIALVSQPEI